MRRLPCSAELANARRAYTYLCKIIYEKDMLARPLRASPSFHSWETRVQYLPARRKTWRKWSRGKGQEENVWWGFLFTLLHRQILVGHISFVRHEMILINYLVRWGKDTGGNQCIVENIICCIIGSCIVVFFASFSALSLRLRLRFGGPPSTIMFANQVILLLLAIKRRSIEAANVLKSCQKVLRTRIVELLMLVSALCSC